MDEKDKPHQESMQLRSDAKMEAILAKFMQQTEAMAAEREARATEQQRLAAAEAEARATEREGRATEQQRLAAAEAEAMANERAAEAAEQQREFFQQTEAKAAQFHGQLQHGVEKISDTVDGLSRGLDSAFERIADTQKEIKDVRHELQNELRDSLAKVHAEIHSNEMRMMDQQRAASQFLEERRTPDQFLNESRPSDYRRAADHQIEMTRHRVADRQRPIDHHRAVDHQAAMHQRPGYDDEVDPAAQVMETGRREYFNNHRDVTCRSDTSEVSSINAESMLIDTLRLSNVIVPKFDGNAVEFHIFMSHFNTNVDLMNVSKNEKFAKLLDACVGKARDVIRPCALMDPEIRYEKAMALLKERFGNPFTISKAWLDDLLQFPVIKSGDAKGLQSFADKLQSCSQVLKELDMESEINTQDRILELMGKLPNPLKEKWRSLAHKVMTKNNRVPKLATFVDFLREAAAEANNPVYGYAPTHSNRANSAGRVFHIQVAGSEHQEPNKMPRTNCASCGGNHMLFACENFKSLSGLARLRLVRERRLCYNCLIPNHRAGQCYKPARCNHSCKRKHSWLLHDILSEHRDAGERPRVEGPRVEAEPRTEPSSDATCGSDPSSSASSEPSSNASSEPGPESSSGHNTSPTSAPASAAGVTRQQTIPSVPRAQTHTTMASHSGLIGNAQVMLSDSKAQVGVKTALPIASISVRVPGSDRAVNTYALIDPGSSNSFCSRALCEQLGITGSESSISLETIGGASPTKVSQVSLEAFGLGLKAKSRQLVSLPCVYALDTFPSLLNSLVSVSEMSQWDHLKGVDLISIPGGAVSLILGQDVPDAIAPVEVIRGGPGEPYAMRTHLGWVVSGPVCGEAVATSHHAHANFIMSTQSDCDVLTHQVERFWAVESTPHEISEQSPEDIRVEKFWKDSLTRVDGHFQLGIPFKSSVLEIPSSRPVAEQRLKGLERRFSRDPDYAIRYTAEIQKLLEKGFAEQVEDEGSGNPVWYVPHHGVANEKKPGKLRVVFDCAAKSDGVSLNQLVCQGPDLTNNLVGVLTRFRVGEVGLMADIEGMFNQVKVEPNHRDVLRFLWWPGGDISLRPVAYRMTTHLFGGIWSPSCAGFALRAAADEISHRFGADIAETVRSNFYVDDCLKSVSSVDEGLCQVEGLVVGLRDCGFRLTKWISNDLAALASVPVEERALGLRTLDLGSHLPMERALGLRWDTSHDTFSVEVTVKNKPCTRRGLLSVVSSVYDPLGFLAPFTLKAKLLMQEECRRGKAWDEPIAESSQQIWDRWCRELPVLSNLTVSRCLYPPGFYCCSVEMHNFCDASEQAYGAVSYLRMVNQSGVVHCSFLLARSRLAPLRQMSIPRLELSAAVLSVQVSSQLARELSIKIDATYYWTDSMVVLHYIRNESRRFQTFVANRVAEITKMSNPDQWCHVGTALNPADEISRGLWAGELRNGSRWLCGPKFLWDHRDMWPKQSTLILSQVLEKDLEVKQRASCNVTIAESTNPVESLISHFSSWLKLRKGVAWLLKFVEWRRLGKPKQSHGLSTQDLKRAEAGILRFTQHTKITAVKAGCGQSSSLKPLMPFTDERGIIRVGGRLNHANLPWDEKHPIIVPKSCHVATLIVRHYHECVTLHGGRETVLGHMREKFWVTGARGLIKSLLNRCVTCRRHRASRTQFMADLPRDRVSPGQSAFSDVGIDCFGPFLIKRGRCEEKRYGCVFSCASTRAIHVEILTSLSADSFLNAFVRFTSRRGLPTLCRSDNGTNFVGAQKELTKALAEWKDCSKVHSHMLSKGVDWKFNPPGASHMGGVWERMIQTIRRTLTFIIGRTVLCEERLHTLMCAVEHVVNSRPLTYVSGDPNDPKPISPNDLLLVGRKLLVVNAEKTHERFGKHWRHVQFLANQFWKRWRREYLPLLQGRSKWREVRNNLKIGDIVLVVDDDAPRNTWPLARVVRTHMGRDNLVRSVEVRRGMTTCTRPVTKIVFLEGS